MFATYSISREALDGVVKRAVASAKRGGREICGVLVTHANVLTPIPLRNKVNGAAVGRSTPERSVKQLP